MKRRRFFETAVLAIPAGSALLAQEPARPPAPAPSPASTPPPGSGTFSMEYPKIDSTTSDLASEPVVRFFSPAQFAALKRLSELLMPRHGELPGAVDAGAPEFLDFLVGKSPADRQQIYIAGLDALNQQSHSQYKKPFAELDDSAAAAVIAPGIEVPWNYNPPTDPLAHFLQLARAEIRSATANSREYVAVSSKGRRQAGMGMYWYPIG